MKRLFVILILLTGCSNRGDEFTNALKGLQRACDVPITLEIHTGQWGNDGTAKCDKLKDIQDEGK